MALTSPLTVPTFSGQDARKSVIDLIDDLVVHSTVSGFSESDVLRRVLPVALNNMQRLPPKWRRSSTGTPRRRKGVRLQRASGAPAQTLLSDPSTAIRRLAEENAALQREAESAQAEYEKLLSEKKAMLEYIWEPVRTEYESTLENLGEKLRETKTKHRRRVEELLSSQEQYQEEVMLEDEELILLTHEVDQYADTLGSRKLEYNQELENIERRLEARHAAEMEALKSEHRANMEVLRESLKQEQQDVKAGYEEEQRKLRRSLESEHNLVANSQKAQLGLALEALTKTRKAQIEKMKKQHARVVEQLDKETAQL
ncbi:hypothetical protein HPB51_011266 [Rhipicephalus microplus]|uniref:Uncharacterized protein n=1 Tax=Rhipicephalus microplus TaxID=6941 RepID=A0A9J6DML9_RHIMP|nr:hypothetical protein HPB51_011266 [Rhipicephalus microplus]